MHPPTEKVVESTDVYLTRERNSYSCKSVSLALLSFPDHSVHSKCGLAPSHSADRGLRNGTTSIKVDLEPETERSIPRATFNGMLCPILRKYECACADSYTPGLTHPAQINVGTRLSWPRIHGPRIRVQCTQYSTSACTSRPLHWDRTQTMK